MPSLVDGDLAVQTKSSSALSQSASDSELNIVAVATASRVSLSLASTSLNFCCFAARTAARDSLLFKHLVNAHHCTNL